MGAESWAKELPKPMKKRAPSNMGSLMEAVWTAAARTMMIQPQMMGNLLPKLSLKIGTTSSETIDPIEYIALRLAYR